MQVNVTVAGKKRRNPSEVYAYVNNRGIDLHIEQLPKNVTLELSIGQAEVLRDVLDKHISFIKKQSCQS